MSIFKNLFRLSSTSSSSTNDEKDFRFDGVKYKVFERIGEGAFAYVYKVKSKKDGTVFAVKQLICQTSEQMDIARKEIDILSLINHKNVLNLLACSSISNKTNNHSIITMLMPIYTMGTLQDFIDNHTSKQSKHHCPFAYSSDVLTVLNSISNGLLAINKVGYRHNDLKPANVLLSEGMKSIVISDLGSASELISTVNSRKDVLLIQDHASQYTTMSIRAPELIELTSSLPFQIDGKSDIWSFGCIMYTTMFGRLPFDGLSSLPILNGAYTIPVCHSWHTEYIDLLRSCICVDSFARLSIDELIDRLARLQPISSSESVSSSSTTPSIITTATAKASTSTTATSTVTINDGLFVADFRTFTHQEPESLPLSVSLTASVDIFRHEDAQSINFDLLNIGPDTHTPAAFTNDDPAHSVDIYHSDKSSVNDDSSNTKLVSVDSVLQVGEILYKWYPIYTMRYKSTLTSTKLLRKSVCLCITSNEIVLRKSDHLKSKIYCIFLLSLPISITSSSLLASGDIGVIIYGYTPSINAATASPVRSTSAVECNKKQVEISFDNDDDRTAFIELIEKHVQVRKS